MTEDLAIWHDLFAHRTDLYAEQQANGAYFPQHNEFTTDHIAEHLAGFASYGTYVIKPVDNTVRYIVFDLDIIDPAAQATLAELVEGMVMKATGGDTEYLNSLLMEFSGNKGHHVWLFLDQPIQAAVARRWVSADFMPKWRAAASEFGWPGDLEVFPKQDEVSEAGFGNLIKLPGGIHAVSGNRSEILGYREWATSVLGVVPLPSQHVIDLVAELPPEVASGGGASRPRRTGGSGVPQSPFACIDFIQNEGAGSGYRDNAMFHLALYLFGHGIPEEYAQSICSEANENFDPPMGDREVLGKVRSAYTGRYEGARCGTGWLDEICPGPCQGGWRVAHTDAGGLAKATVGAAVEVEIRETAVANGKTRIKVSHPDAENAATFVIRK